MVCHRHVRRQTQADAQGVGATATICFLSFGDAHSLLLIIDTVTSSIHPTLSLFITIHRLTRHHHR